MQRGYFAVIPAHVRYDKDLSASAKLLYGEITALCNDKGYCWATNRYFGELYDMSTRNVSRLISSLEKNAYIKIEMIYEGKEIIERRIYIAPPMDKFGHGSRQNCLNGQDENDLTPNDKNGVENNLSLFNNKENNKDNKKNTKKETKTQDLQAEFETLWKLYPRKLGKAKAYKSFQIARKNDKHSYETIEKGLYMYLEYLKFHETEEKYTMHGSTWFAQEKWLDEYTLIAPQKKVTSFMDYYRTEFGGETNEFARDSQIIDYDSVPLPQPNENW